MEIIPDRTSVTLTDLTEIQQAIFQVFCAFETPPTRKAIAEKVKLSVTTVCRAMSEPKFQALYLRTTMGVAQSRLHEVMEAVTDVACDREKGTHLDRRLYLETVGILTKGTKKESAPPPEDNEALEERKKRILEELKSNSTEASIE